MMTPEEEKRQAEIYADLTTASPQPSWHTIFVGHTQWLLAKLAESERLKEELSNRVGEIQEMLSESERARTEADARYAEECRQHDDTRGYVLEQRAALVEEREAHRCSIADNNRLIAELAEARAKTEGSDDAGR